MCSPTVGAASKDRGAMPEIEKGTRGWRNRPEGPGANTPRAPNCSKWGTVEPSSTGPAGMRNSEACSRTSAVVWALV